jgi:hypothetical protein
MTTRSDLRKEAYQYILHTLAEIQVSDNNDNDESRIAWVPLEELRLIKEGIADPSAEFVALLKSMLCNTVSESEIDSHLVTPFEKPNHQ